VAAAFLVAGATHCHGKLGLCGYLGRLRV